MPAPDLATLFQQEERLNRAIVDVLATAAPAFYAHDTRARPADHITVMTELGAASGHVAINDEWDTWDFRLTVSVVTERRPDEPLPQRHGALKGQVRALLSRLSYKFSTGNLAYLQITILKPTGTSVSFDNTQDRAEDITTLEYAGQVCVRAQEWPGNLPARIVLEEDYFLLLEE